MNPKELAARLRWLAAEWRKASPALQDKIEDAFRNGYARGIRLP